LSELTGGNFKDGFIGGAAGAFLSPVSGYLNKNLGFGTAGSGAGWQYLGRTATSAAVGGTVTVISGGKFGNGAATAAFMHLVNSEATNAASRTGLFKNSARFVGNIIRKAWNLPNTVIGLAWGGLGKVVDVVSGRNQMTVDFGNNAIQFHNHPWAGTAETLGNTIHYAGGENSANSWIPQEGHTVAQHEIKHTYQGEQTGPLYLPLIAISYGLSYLIDGPSAYFHGPTSFMERGPQTYGQNNKIWNFSNSYVDPYSSNP
jgi:hypothetical protein